MSLQIGFTNKYFTLWSVTSQENYATTSNGQHYLSSISTSNVYMQNLSIELDSALEKAKSKGVTDLSVNEDLKGQTRSWTSEKQFDEPTPEPSQFRYGRNKYEEINECEDVEYLKWYFYDADCKLAGKQVVALDSNYTIYKGSLVTKEGKIQMKKDEFIESLESGHHFEDGEKIEIELMEVGSFSFAGNYGETTVVTYASKDGKKFKYMGACPTAVSTEEFVKVKATVKFDNYQGENQTKLIRIKLL